MPKRPSIVARGLPLLTWGLTFHILAIAVLFGLFRVPSDIVRGIAAWKEILAVFLVAIVILRAMTGRGPRVAIAPADLFAGGWIALAIAFVITENTVWRNDVPPMAAFLGVRDAAFFVLFYFVGRGTPELADDERVLSRCFWVLVLVSAVAILEQIFVTPRMLVALGVARYINDFLGTPQATAGNVFGLPDNYWSLMGGHLVRRSGSVFLSGQGFATPFLVLLPPATMWVFGRERPASWLARFGYGVIWLGLIFSFTRAVIAVCALQTLLAFVYLKRPTGTALAASVALAVGIVAMAAVPGLPTFIFETLTWQTGSSASHMKDWTNGLTAFFEQPWGYGLGTTDQTALRAGLTPITFDNLFLKYAVEMGVLGLVAVVGTLAAFATAGVQVMRRAITPVERGVGAAVALATLGVCMDGMTAALFNNPIVAYLFFWFAGVAVTLSQRVPSAAPVATPLFGQPRHA